MTHIITHVKLSLQTKCGWGVRQLDGAHIVGVPEMPLITQFCGVFEGVSQPVMRFAIPSSVADNFSPRQILLQFVDGV